MRCNNSSGNQFGKTQTPAGLPPNGSVVKALTWKYGMRISGLAYRWNYKLWNYPTPNANLFGMKILRLFSLAVALPVLALLIASASIPALGSDGKSTFVEGQKA